MDEILGQMRRRNPAVIPRNHLVEAALVSATHGDLAPFRQLLGVLSAPYNDPPAGSEFIQPPPPETPPYRTFCGT